MECFIKVTPKTKRELPWYDFICPPFSNDKYIIYQKSNIYGVKDYIDDMDSMVNCGENVELFIKILNESNKSR